MSSGALSKQPTILAPCPSWDDAKIQNLLQRYPTPSNQKASYGTAGFRQAADAALEAIVTRTAAVAVARSRQWGGQAVGVMITASHNDESYNGVKIADPSGGMLAPDGEQMAIYLANEQDITAVMEWICRYCRGGGGGSARNTQDAINNNMTAVVHVGRDTRSHSFHFRQLLVDMITAVGGYVVDHGVCTTPMLHHAVLHENFVTYLPSLIPPRPNAAGYFSLLASSYVALCATVCPSTSAPTPSLLVDCACGVGYPAIVQLIAALRELGMPAHKMIPTNSPGSGPLNEGCGSEHVQKSQSAPVWYNGLSSSSSTAYCAALDGDADRVVFFAQTNGSFQLLDGDKISCLFCQFIQEQLATLEPYLQAMSSSKMSIRLGVVQTAYANGASTKVLQQLVGRENVLIAKTGVKHVHEAAHQNFDIGVYFEANGHGTILFGPHFYAAVSLLEAHICRHPKEMGKQQSAAMVALKRLQLLPALVNQAVGDALSDLLLVDAILTLQGRSIEDWNAMYQDLPSRQSKVMVPDRNVIKTNANETKCVAPVGLQQDLNKAMKTYDGRSFVRPSGTEDIVRVYAEAPTQNAADGLAKKAEQIVQRFTLPSKM